MDPATDTSGTNHRSQTPAKRGSNWLSRTSGVFVAEYCTFIISLGIALASLNGLIYVFFMLAVGAMHSSDIYSPAIKLIALWLLIASVVSLPLAAILWSRTRGELVANKDLNGALPGGAKGFRTFWIVLIILGMISMLILALYSPLALLVAGARGVPESLLGATLPSLLNIAVAASGVYMVTRPASDARISRLLLWAVVGMTVLLFVVNFTWAANAPNYSPYRTYPSYDDSY